jgi:3-oxoacyl-[acyl-carrier protein] reductase
MLRVPKVLRGLVAGELAGKIVVVTGASSGIGRAIAVACARAGATLVITYRQNQEGATQVAREIRGLGQRVESLRADVSRAGDVDAVVARARETFGRVDVWINNAGADILTGGAREMSRVEKLDLVLDVDLRGTILASWAAVELMREQPRGGAIINMAWDHVGQGMAGENPELYSAAKGGIASFSRSLARSVAPNVRVNLIAPGFIDTAFGQGDASANWRRHVEEITPLGRWGTPEDVAAVAVFLASDAAAFLTGQTINVNGGVVM